MPEKTAFKGGLELKFFDQREFESIVGLDPSQQTAIFARNILRFFTMGWTLSWTQFLTPSLLYSFFIQRSPEILKEVRFAMQQGFFELFEQLRNKKLNTDEDEQVKLFMSNCMAMLPYGDLNPFEEIKIPQCIDGEWELVEYQIIPIELTQKTGWRSFFTYDHDRVFAYGLEPLLQKKAESHLIFMGTTYPAGQGFLSQINTDLKGFETVGKSLYRSGRERIQHWLSQQENTIHVCGISLGGALSLLVAIDKGNYKLSRVDALNPPGLYDFLFKSRYDHWDKLTEKPKVVVQKQGNDLVPTFGIWKNDWIILQVTPPKEKQGPNAFLDHCLNYAGFADTEFKYIPAKHDNSNRTAKNHLLFALARSWIYYYILVPYTYIVRPLGYYALKKFFTKETQASRLEDFFDLAQMHHPSLPRNTTMDIYNTENSVEIELSYDQLHTYYYVMRCLLKKKDFLPDTEEESKHVKGVTKKSLLMDSRDSDKSHTMLSFKATKAKVAHMKHTLTLVHQLGIENIEKLKPALEKEYETYRLGKL